MFLTKFLEREKMRHGTFCEKRFLGELSNVQTQDANIERLVVDGVLCQIDVLDAGFFIEDANVNKSFEADTIFEKSALIIIQLLRQVDEASVLE